MTTVVDPDSYYALLRALKGLPKEANNELRVESRKIAETIIKPAVTNAIIQQAGNYGPKLVKSVSVSRDRVPKIRVGNNRKTFSGGASANIIRYGTIVGPYLARTERGRTGQQMWPETVTPGWTKSASNDYTQPVFDAWQNSVAKIVIKWNGGK